MNEYATPTRRPSLDRTLDASLETPRTTSPSAGAPAGALRLLDHEQGTLTETLDRPNLADNRPADAQVRQLGDDRADAASASDTDGGLDDTDAVDDTTSDETDETEEDSEDGEGEGEGEGASEEEAGTEDGEGGAEESEEGEGDAAGAGAGAARGGGRRAVAGASRDASRRAPAKYFIPPRPARLGVPRLRVPLPPPMPAGRIDAITRQTKISPREHHSRVRRRADAVQRFARRSQLEVVHRAEWAAKDVKHGIRGEAKAVARVADHTMAQVRRLMRGVQDRIYASAWEAREDIRTAVVADLDTMTRQREQALQTIQDHLIRESGLVRDASAALQAQYPEVSANAAAEMRHLPNTPTGSFDSLPLPTPTSDASGGGAGGMSMLPPIPGVAEEPSDEGAMMLEGRRLADQFRPEEPGPDTMYGYKLWRWSHHLPDAARGRLRDELRGANAKANALDGPAVHQSMLMELAGLANPAALALEEDTTGERERERQAIQTEQQAVESARNDAMSSVDNILDKIINDPESGLVVQERKMLEGLATAKRKAVRSLMQQAEVASNTILSAVAGWARAWVEALDPVLELLPPDTFLESEALLPQLEAHLEALGTLRENQLATIASQREQSLANATKARVDITKSIRSIYPRTRDQMNAFAAGAERDFSLRGFMWTNDVDAGVEAALESAVAHAEETLREKFSQDQGNIASGVHRYMCEKIVPRLEKQIGDYKLQHDEAVTGMGAVFAEPGGLYDRLNRQVDLEIREKRANLEGALPVVSTGAVVAIGVVSVFSLGIGAAAAAGYGYHTDPDEDKALETVTSVPRQGRGALEDEFNDHYDPSLRTRLDRLSDREEATILAFLDSRTAEDEADALATLGESTSQWWGFSNAARQNAVSSMPDDSLAALRQSPDFETTKQQLLDDLNPSQVDITSSYLDHGVAAGFEAKTRQALNKARQKGDENFVREIQNLEQSALTAIHGAHYAAFVDPDTHRRFLDDVYQAGAARVQGRSAPTWNPNSERPEGGNLSPEQARQQYAEGLTQNQMFRRNLGENAQQVAEAAIVNGQDSDEYFIEHAAFWTERADRVGGPTQNQEVGIQAAYADPQLHAAMEQMESAAPGSLAYRQAAARVAELREKRDRRMEGLADRLGLERGEGETGTDVVASNLSTILLRGHRSRADEARTFADTLVRNGRGDLLSGILLASRGWGSTNDDLLRAVTSGRSMRETQAARDQYADDVNGPDDALDRMLGIGKNASWFGGETSGDLAHEIERNMVGGASTDRGRTTTALLAVFQQVDDSPGLFSGVLQDSPAGQEVHQDRDRLVAFLAEASGKSPSDVLNADGRPNQDVLDAAFGEDGTLVRLPNETDDAFAARQFRLGTLTEHAQLGSRLYRDHVDRIEAAAMVGVAVFTAILTLALIASGVGIALAGVIAAVAGGVATMGVKFGVRGAGRYGYEEAAVDVAMTAVEAGVAWAGGAALGQFGKVGGVAGRLAQANTALTSGLARGIGQTGARIAMAGIREGIQGGITGAARAAMDPNTWRDDGAAALGRIGKSAGRAAAVQSITGVVSEGIGAGFNRSGNRAVGQLDDVLDPARAQAARSATRTPLADSLLEGTSEALGGMAGEAVGLGIDRSTGAYDGDTDEGLLRVLKAGGREFAMGAVRSGLISHHRGRVADMERRLATQDGPIRPDQVRAYRQAMIAAGALGYGRDDNLLHALRDVSNRQQMLRGLDPETQGLLSGLRSDILADVVSRLDAGDLGDPVQRDVLLARVAEADPRLDMARFEGLFGASRPQGAEPAAPARTAADARADVLAALPPAIRDRLGDVKLDGLDSLPPSLLRELGAAVAAGRSEDLGTLIGLSRSARRFDADFDVSVLQTAMKDLGTAAVAANQRLQSEANTQRKALLPRVPAEHRHVLGLLDDASLLRLAAALDGDGPPSLQDRAALLRAARQVDPNVDIKRFNDAILAMHTARRAPADAERAQRRADRAADLDSLPARLRGPLSALPDAAVATLNDYLARGHVPNVQERAALVRAARAETPDLDVARFDQALRNATSEASSRKAAAEAAAAVELRTLRGAMLDAVPVALKTELGATPIRVLSDADYQAHRPADATSHGFIDLSTAPPTLVVRRGSPPEAMAELGATLAIMRDPAQAETVARAHAGRDDAYHDLPVTQQVASHRAQLELQIDAQNQILAGLREAMTRPGADVPTLQRQIYRAQRALVGLREAHAQVRVGLFRRVGIALGVADPPPILQQVPRMIAEDPEIRLGALEAARTDVISGFRFEPGVDAAGNPVLDATGAPRGYGIDYGFDVRSFRSGLTQITVKVHLDPDAGVTHAELATLRANAQTGLDQYYNFRHSVPGMGGKRGRLHVQVEFVNDPAMAHVSVKVPHGGDAFQRTWPKDANPTTLAHELSHQLGRIDEYADHAPYGFWAKNRRHGGSPGVRTDHGLMGNYWLGAQVHPATHVAQRYLDELSADIGWARRSALGRLAGRMWGRVTGRAPAPMLERNWSGAPRMDGAEVAAARQLTPLEQAFVDAYPGTRIPAQVRKNAERFGREYQALTQLAHSGAHLPPWMANQLGQRLDRLRQDFEAFVTALPVQVDVPTLMNVVRQQVATVLPGRGLVDLPPLLQDMSGAPLRTEGPQASFVVTRENVDLVIGQLSKDGRFVAVMQETSVGNVVRFGTDQSAEDVRAGLEALLVHGGPHEVVLTVVRAEGADAAHLETALAREAIADLSPGGRLDQSEHRLQAAESFEALSTFINRMLDPVSADHIRSILENSGDPAKALTALSLSSGFGSMEGMNAIYHAIQSFGSSGTNVRLYAPGGASIGDNLRYLSGKGILSGRGITETTELGPRTVVVLDFTILQNAELLRAMVEAGCKFVYPRGMEHGFNPFNTAVRSDQAHPLTVEQRVNQLIQQADSRVTTEGGTFEAALIRVLEQDLAPHLAEGGALHNIDIVRVGPEGDASVDALARQLSGFAGITPDALRLGVRAVLDEAGVSPEHLAPFGGGEALLRKWLAASIDVLGPRALGEAMILAQQTHGQDARVFIHRAFRSFGMVALAHHLATGSPSAQYIRRAFAFTGPFMTILDDVSGSGTSLKEAIRGGPDRARNRGARENVAVDENNNPVSLENSTGKSRYKGTLYLQPVYATTEAAALIQRVNNTLGDLAVDFLPLRASPTRAELSAAEVMAMDMIILNTAGRGWSRNALALAFPYMAPNNNAVFFARTFARYFILNRTQAASKEHVDDD